MSKTVIVYGPQGCGKTINAERLRKHFGCTHVIELDEQRRRQLHEGALHLSHQDPATLRSLGWRVDGVTTYSMAQCQRFVSGLVVPEDLHGKKAIA